MDINKLFYLQQRAEIVEYDYEHKKEYIYQSRIEDIQGDGLYMSEPYLRGFYLPRHYDKEYMVQVPGENCSYLFKTRLLRCVKDPILMWVMAMPQAAVRKQRRDFVRLDIRLDVQVEVLLEEEESLMGFVASTKDISGSGMGLLLKNAELLQPDMRVKLTWMLGDETPVCAEGIVLRIIEPEAEYDKPVAAIRFDKIDKKQKDQITKFVFRKQIERRRKEVELFR